MTQQQDREMVATGQASTQPQGRTVRYQLRFQILPGPNAESDARRLAAFCHEYGIEEAVLFVASEEWNDGLMSREEEDRWIEMLRQVKPILDDAGLLVSVNPWATVLHRAQGRRFPADRNFEPMTSPLGEQSSACGSVADPVWQEYITSQYARYAELGFRVIWIEDDFRYHNHKPLTWGGGFEPRMLERFSKKVGRPVEREELVRNLLKPGEPHPWRALWMETWGDGHIETTRALTEAVRQHATGESAMGLMSGLPKSHSIEGRRWKEMFESLSIDGRVAHRPHFGGGGAYDGRGMAKGFLMLDRQRLFQPAGCEVAPEVENYPFTHWGKSERKTWAEMAQCLVLGSDALFLDLFPFSGNPADRDPRIGQMLARSRPGLQWIVDHFSKEQVSCGVGLPWREDSQSRVHLERGESLDELDADFMPAGQFLMRYGVPASARTQPVNAVFGSLASTFDDEEIADLLSGGLILDGQSAAILCRRGFSEDLGVDCHRWLDREDSNFSLEEVMTDAGGIEIGHYFPLYRVPGIAQLDARPGATEWTQVITPQKERIGSGMVTYENARGGRVVTYALGDPGQWFLHGDQRQQMLHRAIDFAGGGAFGSPIVSGGAHLLPVHLRQGNQNYLAILNGSSDPAQPVVRIPGQLAQAPEATLLPPLAEPAAAPLRIEPSGEDVQVVSEVEVPHAGYLVLAWSSE